MKEFIIEIEVGVVSSGFKLIPEVLIFVFLELAYPDDVCI